MLVGDEASLIEAFKDTRGYTTHLLRGESPDCFPNFPSEKKTPFSLLTENKGMREGLEAWILNKGKGKGGGLNPKGRGVW